MNLLIINLDKNIFKSGSTSLERLKEYSKLVENIFVIVWTRWKEDPIIYNDKLFIYPTNSRCRLLYYWDSLRLARKIFKEKQIDLIFTQDPFETGLAGWFISKMKKIPLQLQIHTDFLSPYFWQESLSNKFRVLLAKFLIPKAQTLRVVSERIKNSVVSTFSFPVSRIFVLPIFVDVRAIQAATGGVDLHKKYSQFNFIILMASRFSKEKNIDLGIRTMGQIVESYPQTGLIIVGSGPEEEKLKSLVEKKGLVKNIKFESWTKDIFSYYKSADLFLLASNYEGYGLTVIEAMASGCPILMTDVGCAGETVKNEDSGLVVFVGDENNLSVVLKRVIEDKNLRERIGLNGLKYVEGFNSVDRYLEIYKKSWESTNTKY